MEITSKEFDKVLERFVPAFENRDQFNISKTTAIRMAIENAFLFPNNFDETDIDILRQAGHELQNPGYLTFKTSE